MNKPLSLITFTNNFANKRACWMCETQALHCVMPHSFRWTEATKFGIGGS